jgi:flagellar basal-body rod protein FlgC
VAFMDSLRISASALTAERLRMDVISSNVANANSTRGTNGQVYQRQRVVFQSMSAQDANQPGSGVAVAAVVSDTRPGNSVYDPGHPDANAQGYVNYPNVDIATEMVDMMSATRAYEANVVAAQAAKTMVARALEITQG